MTSLMWHEERIELNILISAYMIRQFCMPYMSGALYIIHFNGPGEWGDNVRTYSILSVPLNLKTISHWSVHPAIVYGLRLFDIL